MSRRASVRRARTDAEWRAAMGIRMDDVVPDEKTVREFEKFLRQRHLESGVPRYLLFHEHVVRLCSEAEVVGQDAVWTQDSTPMWCYGATLDTVRLLGDGLRTLAGRWAKATRRPIEAVAEEWKLPWLLAKSTKGGLTADWRDRTARREAVSRLAHDVLGVVDRVRAGVDGVRAGFRRSILRLSRNLLRIVRDDFETDKNGQMVIARRVAKERLVSLTDPEARNGRKSKSSKYKGFKLHVLGDVASGLIASVAVTVGNLHDSKPAHRLIRRAKELFDSIERVLADTAYGAAELHKTIRVTLGVDILAPPVPVTPSKRKKCFGKSDFAFDLDQGIALCPNDVTTDELTEVRKNGQPCPRFRWPKEACSTCSLRSECMGTRSGRRTLVLHPHERELIELRARWDQPETRLAYRVRIQCERLVNQLVRHGARQARAWGLGAAQLQVHTIAASCNLALLARAFAAAA